jgi:hypothetical protein
MIPFSIEMYQNRDLSVKFNDRWYGKEYYTLTRRSSLFTRRRGVLLSNIASTNRRRIVYEFSPGV